MELTEEELANASDILQELGQEGTVLDNVQGALEAYVEGKASDDAKRLLKAAGYELIGQGVWSRIPSMTGVKKSDSLSEEQANEILKLAWEAGLYPTIPPTERGELIAEAKEVITLVVSSEEHTEVNNRILDLAKGTHHTSVPDELATVPFDGYDGMAITEIKMRTEAGEFDKYLDSIADYENTLKKPRVRVLGYVQKRKEDLLEEKYEPQASEEIPEAEKERAGEAEDAAPQLNDSGGEVGAEESPSDSEDASDESGRVEAEYEELVKDAEKEVDTRFLHIPPNPPTEDINVPFDVTQISDQKLQKLYAAYSALAYRVNYLLALEEAKLRRVKLAVKDVRSYLFAESVKYDHQKHQRTMTDINSHIDQVPAMKEWLLKENILESNVEAYRSQRDGYYREVDMLSRLATMRQQEADRSGHR